MVDPLVKIEIYIYFAHLAEELDHVVLRPVSKRLTSAFSNKDHGSYFSLKARIYNLSDMQMEYHLLGKMNFKRFCAYQYAINIPDRTKLCRLSRSGLMKLVLKPFSIV